MPIKPSYCWNGGARLLGCAGSAHAHEWCHVRPRVSTCISCCYLFKKNCSLGAVLLVFPRLLEYISAVMTLEGGDAAALLTRADIPELVKAVEEALTKPPPGDPSTSGGKFFIVRATDRL